MRGTPSAATRKPPPLPSPKRGASWQNACRLDGAKWISLRYRSDTAHAEGGNFAPRRHADAWAAGDRRGSIAVAGRAWKRPAHRDRPIAEHRRGRPPLWTGCSLGAGSPQSLWSVGPRSLPPLSLKAIAASRARPTG